MDKPPTNRTSTIKNDPFAALIPKPPSEPPIAAPIEASLPPPDAVTPIRKETPGASTTDREAVRVARNRRKLTLHLDENTVNRIKNAAYWNPRLTIVKIAEKGIRQAIAQIEKEYGGPYPQRESELVGGRPMK